MRFSTWEPLATAIAPAGPGVLQARAGIGTDGLIAYPKGKSAMVYYDADDDLVLALVRARRVATTASMVRFATTATAKADLERLLRDFVVRFGALPGNE